MLIEKELFEEWMKRIMERFDGLEKRILKPCGKERRKFNGEELLDNQDLCVMLNICKRSLQRYRSLGWLPFRRIDQKTYYLPSEVDPFIREHFDRPPDKNGKGGDRRKNNKENTTNHEK